MLTESIIHKAWRKAVHVLAAVRDVKTPQRFDAPAKALPTAVIPLYGALITISARDGLFARLVGTVGSPYYAALAVTLLAVPLYWVGALLDASAFQLANRGALMASLGARFVALEAPVAGLYALSDDWGPYDTLILTCAVALAWLNCHKDLEAAVHRELAYTTYVGHAISAKLGTPSKRPS